jgi:hypothetical protein
MAEVHGAGPPDGPVQEEEPALPPQLADVLHNLEEAAAAHDDELAGLLDSLTPAAAEGDERPGDEPGPAG